jgi:hypothetical protein
MNTPSPETPTHQLARQIIDRLVQEGLMSEEAGRKLLPKLSAGTLRGEDWRLPIELETAKERPQ